MNGCNAERLDGPRSWSKAGRRPMLTEAERVLPLDAGFHGPARPADGGSD